MSTVEEVILQPAERYIHLSSEFGLKNINQSTSDVRFPIGAPIGQSTDEYCMFVGIHNATIPHTWYNMNGFAWKIFFNYPLLPFSGEISGTIPAGNYSTTTLATALQTSVRAAQIAVFGAGTDTFTVTYDSLTNFYTFTNGAVGPGTTGAWAFVSTPNDCYLELGLRNLHYGNINIAYSAAVGSQWVLTPISMADLSRYHGVYVLLQGYSSNALTSYNGLNQAPILCRIPIKQPFGAIETYEPSVVTYIPIPNAVFTDLQIQMVGDDGNALDLNGTDWTITLHLKYGAIRRQEPQRDRMLPSSSVSATQAFGGRRVI
jgi:hypothetical protein